MVDTRGLGDRRYKMACGMGFRGLREFRMEVVPSIFFLRLRFRKGSLSGILSFSIISKFEYYY